jgi:hypothetical protein
MFTNELYKIQINSAISSVFRGSIFFDRMIGEVIRNYCFKL